MRISRLVIRNFRSLELIDIELLKNISCIIGENNTGKSALVRAIQICIDSSSSGYIRNLQKEDIYSGIDISSPSQVLIGLELTDFEGKVNEEALVGTWKLGVDKARVFYRFRPRRAVREKLLVGELEAGQLTIDDYSWEIKGGGDPAVDLRDIEWDEDEIGENIRFSDLQSMLVVTLPPLRDVESDFRNGRISPLVKLIESFEISDVEKNDLIGIMDEANEKISHSAAISDISSALDEGFKHVSGPAFEMGSSLGISGATFQSIIRNIKIILNDHSLECFETARNGLGMNNILYLATLLEYFKKRIEKANTAGQLLLIEEPEAHLHPQLQSSLLKALMNFNAQIIVTTHSTNVSSQVPFSSLLSLTRRSDDKISGVSLGAIPSLYDDQISDLERYLDATKSNLLFARRVMLVEGAAELFLLPKLVESVLGLDLERVGVSVIAIHGVHFDVYAKLFGPSELQKKCAIVCDADLHPSDANDEFDPEEVRPTLMALKNEYVEIFLGATTFEMELVSEGTLPMFISAIDYLGAPVVKKQLDNCLEVLVDGDHGSPEYEQVINLARQKVLSTAKRFGKGRFAQVCARFSDQASEVPKYIKDAVEWLLL